MARIYTRTGDAGETGLFDGTRVRKDALRVAAYGTVDELNSQLSLARLATDDQALQQATRDIQRFLFVLGADIATPPDTPAGRKVRRVAPADVKQLEDWIDAYWARLDPLDAFIVPGETVAAAHFHVARTVCRRAERLCVRLARTAPLNEDVVRYLNRLSDLLFTWGRAADQGVATPDAIDGLRDG